MCTIRLHDGQEITGLKMNGTNFVSETKIDESIFTNNLKTMTVIDGDKEYEYHNVELIQQVQYADGWYSCFRELTADEIEKKTISDNITDIQVAIAEIYESTLQEVIEMAKIYAELIRKGVKKIEDVPAKLRKQVENLLKEYE